MLSPFLFAASMVTTVAGFHAPEMGAGKVQLLRLDQ
jgi:hypothetical protein